MELIGTKIQTLRKNKNMTQAQLAQVLAVSSQSVSKWENHLSAPDISLLPIIARFFGITMDELFNYRLDALNYRERFIRFIANYSLSGCISYFSFGIFSPAASRALGHGPRKVLIRARVASSKSALMGGLPSSRALSWSCRIAQSFFFSSVIGIMG